jgi:hypothetical protein
MKAARKLPGVTKSNRKRLCRFDKKEGARECKMLFYETQCIEKRQAITKAIAKKTSSCAKVLKSCVPIPIVRCASAVAACLADKTPGVADAANKVKQGCDTLIYCKDHCLLLPKGKQAKDCKKNCRKKYKDAACKTARKGLVLKAVTAGFTCAKKVLACGFGINF